MTDKSIWRLFGGRCVVCKHPATELNHIVPRSADQFKINEWKNKVPLCNRCHRLFHDGGVTDEKIKQMIKYRADFLTAIGKGEHI